VPGGIIGAAVVTILTTGFALLASVALLWPGIGSDDPDGSLPEGFARGDYELTQLLPLIVFVIIGVLFYVAGRPTRDKMVSIPIEQEMGVEAPA
jgi:hypothetical protein